jgi:hypothetical protein
MCPHHVPVGVLQVGFSKARARPTLEIFLVLNTIQFSGPWEKMPRPCRKHVVGDTGHQLKPHHPLLSHWELEAQGGHSEVICSTHSPGMKAELMLSGLVPQRSRRQCCVEVPSSLLPKQSGSGWGSRPLCNLLPGSSQGQGRSPAALQENTCVLSLRTHQNWELEWGCPIQLRALHGSASFPSQGKGSCFPTHGGDVIR